MTELTDDQMKHVTGGQGMSQIFEDCLNDQRNKKKSEEDAMGYCCKNVGGDSRCNQAGVKDLLF